MTSCDECGSNRVHDHMVWRDGGYRPALICDACGAIQGVRAAATAPVEGTVAEPARRRRVIGSEEPANG